MSSKGVILVVSILSLATAASAAAVEDFRAFLLPPVSNVDVESLVTVTFEIDSTARHFNGFTLEFLYDPTVVEFESAARGSLMVAVYGNSMFDHIAETESTVAHTLVGLGAGITVDGPGELSRYTFRGLSPGVSPVDAISDPDCTFFDAGRCVNATDSIPRNVTIEDAQIISGSTSAPPGAGLGSGLRVRFAPNPLRSGGGWLEITSEHAEPIRAEVFTAGGRRVWTWPEVEGGEARLFWPGGVQGEGPLASGVYFYRVQSGRETRAGKLVRVR